MDDIIIKKEYGKRSTLKVLSDYKPTKVYVEEADNQVKKDPKISKTCIHLVSLNCENKLLDSQNYHVLLPEMLI